MTIDNAFDIPAEWQENVRDATVTQIGVQLPFDALYLRWHNGQANAIPQGSVAHCGGWVVLREGNYQSFLAVNNLAPHPKFAAESFVSREGEAYEIEAVRMVLAAPFARRFRWTEKSSRVQWVVLLGVVDENREYMPWAPAVLHATGHSGIQVDNAIREWARATSPARRTHANGIMESFFYIPLGTHGGRHQIMVGKGNNQSPITPCQTIYPDGEITADYLRKCYVGRSIAEQIGKMAADSAEWIADWKREDGEESTETERGHPANNRPMSEDDEIPF